MLGGVENFALLRLALLANSLVFGQAILVKVPAADTTLGHVVGRRAGGFLRREQNKRKKISLFSSENKQKLSKGCAWYFIYISYFLSSLLP